MFLNAVLLPGQTAFYSVGSGYAKAMQVNNIANAGDFSDSGGGAASIATVRPSWAPGGRTSISILHPLVRAGGAAGAVPSYEVEDLVITNPYEPATAKMGVFTISAGQDFNGDGAPDIIVGTYPSGYAVVVY